MSNNTGRKLKRRQDAQFSYEQYTLKKQMEKRREKAMIARHEMIAQIEEVMMRNSADWQCKLANQLPPKWALEKLESLCVRMLPKHPNLVAFIERYVGGFFVKFRQRILMLGITHHTEMTKDLNIRFTVKRWGQKIVQKDYKL